MSSTAGLKAAPTAIKFLTVEMTPDRAMELLAGADPNRTVQERRVNSHARDMLGGKWQLNGEAIMIEPGGKLINGEHRLWGVVRAGEQGLKSVAMHVALDVPREARPTIDTGKSRSYADVLKIRGYAGGGRTIASILRYIVLYRAGALSSIKGTIQATHSEMDAVYTEKSTIQSLEYFQTTWARRVRYAASVGFVWWRARQDDEAKADEWVEGLASGTEMKASDPRFQLRERYVEAVVRPMPASEAIALAIKSWNLYYAGATAPNLRWRQRGNAAEGFPAFYTDEHPATTTRAPGQRAVIDRQLQRQAKTAKVHGNGR